MVSLQGRPPPLDQQLRQAQPASDARLLRRSRNLSRPPLYHPEHLVRDRQGPEGGGYFGLVHLLGQMPALRSVEMNLATLLTTWTQADGGFPARVVLFKPTAVPNTRFNDAESRLFQDVRTLCLLHRATLWYASQKSGLFAACQRTAFHRACRGAVRRPISCSCSAERRGLVLFAQQHGLQESARRRRLPRPCLFQTSVASVDDRLLSEHAPLSYSSTA